MDKIWLAHTVYLTQLKSLEVPADNQRKNWTVPDTPRFIDAWNLVKFQVLLCKYSIGIREAYHCLWWQNGRVRWLGPKENTCIHLHMHTCAHTHIHAQRHTHAHIHICTCMYACMNMHTQTKCHRGGDLWTTTPRQLRSPLLSMKGDGFHPWGWPLA